MTLAIGAANTFWTIGAVAAAGAVWVYCMLPETKGTGRGMQWCGAL